jgi:hypothetical protein
MHLTSGRGSPDPLGRGVWQAPFDGPDGEMVLVAVTSRGRIVGEVAVIPHGASRVETAERMLAALDLADPVAVLRAI